MASQTFTAAQVLTAAQMNTLANTVDGYATTATAAGTTTLTVASYYQQFFTGSTTQTVVMPVASTLVVGWKIRVVNNSSGIVTVQSSGANTIYAVPAGGDVIFTCILASGTTAASWDYKNHISSGSSGLTKIVAASFSATTAVNVTSCFSATYKRYRIQIKAKGDSAGQTMFVKFRVASTDVSTAYYWTNASVGTTGPTQTLTAGSALTTGFDLGTISQSTNFSTAIIDVMHPFVNNLQCDAIWSVSSLGTSTTSLSKFGAGSQNNTASGIIDGFSIIFGGNSTGEYVVYGYAD